MPFERINIEKTGAGYEIEVECANARPSFKRWVEHAGDMWNAVDKAMDAFSELTKQPKPERLSGAIAATERPKVAPSRRTKRQGIESGQSGLLGAVSQPGMIDIGADFIPLREIVAEACLEADLSPEAWNGLNDSERDARISAIVVRKRAAVAAQETAAA